MRAVPALVTVAGMAAVGASFTGTAAADEPADVDSILDSSSDSGSSGENSFDDDSNTPSLSEDGLFTFDMPEMQTSGH